MQGVLVRRRPVILPVYDKTISLQSESTIMARLHLFNPENDIALAAGTANFTAPRAALALRSAGAALPLWYADDGDRILCNGINAQWLTSVRERFGIGCDVFDHAPGSPLTPSPWGWSAAVRREFAAEGFAQDRLPSDTDLAMRRMLSHRRTAILLNKAIAPVLGFAIAPPAAEFSDSRQLAAWLADNPAAMLKSPWSSSGRGLTDTRHTSPVETLRRAEGIIRHQGSVMAEPAYDRTGDFALLFHCRDGVCRHSGYSFFSTNGAGAYSGNVVAGDSDILAMIGRLYPAERILAAASAIADALTAIVAPHYNGPLGVDMLTARMPDGSVLLDASVELNLRMTMGFVAHNLAARYLAEGSAGTFSIRPVSDTQAPAPDEIIIDSRRIVSGRMMLTPPGGRFRFELEISQR